MPFELRNIDTREVLYRNNFSIQELNQPALTERSLRLELPFADVLINQSLFDGIRILFNTWHFKGNAPIIWEGNEDIVCLQFNLKGSLHMQAGEWPTMLTVADNHHNLLYDHRMTGRVPARTRGSSTFLIQFTREAFLKLAANTGGVLARFAESVTTGPAGGGVQPHPAEKTTRHKNRLRPGPHSLRPGIPAAEP